ncbi:unnamed protein product [Candidula unifasciata]|uniref:Apextrin C-terminal domain-containing protein n=1 Tax=Candidula unifasciata TaxID=100452 RepID=A0A8S3YK64_9EUPU|nr:unnamed protein product [Candidula unifasciata]
MFRVCHSLLVALCLLKHARGDFVLSINPSQVLIGITENVTIQCEFKGSVSASEYDTIDRLRILKETATHDYQIVTEVRKVDHGVDISSSLSSSVKVHGNISNVASTFITLSWSLATSDVLGTYRCDIFGYKANFDVLFEKTPVKVLQEIKPSVQETINLWKKQRGDIQQKISARRDYCDSLVAAVHADINATVADIEQLERNQSNVFKDALLQKVTMLSQKVARLKDTGVFQYWPEGSYALLTPNSGCPENVGALWATGYRKLHTESTDRNFDSISTPSYLQSPSMETVDRNNFMYQHFCVSSGRSRGPAWPRGSYCINQAANGCPSGLSSGYISWQDEVTNSTSSSAGALPRGDYRANSTRIYYCCRADGPASHPIYLPTFKPFYLYRYNGTCQEVCGMKTSSGNMVFDTDNSHGDSYENPFHPDGTIDNVRIELCYYSP